ncbi:MAG: hypothetical protein IKF82_00600 [Bacilli bacterium]|nr:hypothetical protein [Bacilli bacterium]
MAKRIEEDFYTAIIDKNIPYLKESSAKCNIRVDITVNNSQVFKKLIEYIDNFKVIE